MIGAKDNKHSRLFFKYFLSYSVIIVILTMLLGLLLRQYVIIRIYEKVEQDNSYMIEERMSWLNENLSALHATSMQIELMSPGSPYLIVNSPTDQSRMIKNLGALQSTTPYIKDIALWYAERPSKLITISGMTHFDVFARNRAGGWGSERLSQVIQNVHGTSLMLGSENVNEYLFFSSIPSGAPVSHACMLFVLDGEAIMHTLGDIARHNDGFVRVGDAFDNQAFVWGDAAKADAGAYTNKNYIIVESTTKYGLTCTIGLNRASVRGETVHIWQVCMTILLLSLLVGLALALVAAERIYRPIRLLTVRAGVNMGGAARDELMALADALRSLTEKQLETEDVVQHIRHQLLDSLLLQAMEDGSLERLQKFSHLQLHEEYLVVVRLGWRGMMIPRDIIAALEAYKGDELLHIREETAVHRLYLILNIPSGAQREAIQSVDALLACVPDTLRGSLQVGVGDCVTELNELHISYAGTETIFESGVFSIYEGIVGIDQVRGIAPDVYTYPKESQQKLQYALLSTQPEQANEIARKAVERLRAGGAGERLQRSIFISILHSVKSALEHHNRLTPPMEAGIHSYILHAGEDETSTGDQFIFVIALLAELMTQSTHNDAPQIRRIISYIEKNFSSYELSLGSVARFAGLSPSYLTRLFREATGRSVKEAIDAVRMDHARKLLLESDEPISRIAIEVGYYDANSFSRKFKSLEGVPPLQYRMLHVGGTNNDYKESSR